MNSLFATIAELQKKAAELRGLVSLTSGSKGSRLRESLYQLEAAIYAMERNAADTYKALTASTEPSDHHASQEASRSVELQTKR